ncbi:peptide chain release factor N(5)-glutamine methyltransferase [Thioclava sp. FR2]|uniref:peptide chain release factor N(5)-glutamine methyltransferase n=1 Tax=Thioclava sp. FR2 TaxID=3445780 RepID=UPI003EBCA25E
MTVWSVHLVKAVEVLRQAGIPDASRDARMILAHAAGFSPDRLSLHLPETAAPALVDRFQSLIEQRARRVPVSHILGQRPFWRHVFKVTPAVLDPRPETEILVQAALAEPFQSVLDLGLGSGCILFSLLSDAPQAEGVGVDLSREALAIARINCGQLNLGERADLRLGSWYDPVSEEFDLIVSNPPYIAQSDMDELAPEVLDHEPRMALTDEADGLSAYRSIGEGALSHLSPKGRLLVEIGPTQGLAVSEIFRNHGLVEVAVLKDLDGRDRVVSARARGI